MPVDADEKTEPATPRRRTEAKNQGQIARSQDLTAAVSLIAALLVLNWLGPGMWFRLLAVMKRSLGSESLGDSDQIISYASSVALETFKIVGPIFAIILFVVLLISWAQVGLNFTLHPLKPSLDKLNPINGIKRMFSARSAATMVINLGKLIIVSGAAYLTVMSNVDRIILAGSLSFENLFLAAARMIYQLGIRLALVLLVLALIDYAYQRHRHEQDLKMSKQEVKDELKNMDGDPVAKQRRRKVQLDLYRQRLQRDVANADMVLTNPTHLAIAIKYDSETMVAPKVLAKGADYWAMRIRQFATERGIPIVERRSLVRIMYEEVEVGQYIPEKFYQAVAEVLAYVYQISGKMPSQLASA